MTTGFEPPPSTDFLVPCKHGSYTINWSDCHNKKTFQMANVTTHHWDAVYTKIHILLYDFRTNYETIIWIPIMYMWSMKTVFLSLFVWFHSCYSRVDLCPNIVTQSKIYRFICEPKYFLVFSIAIHPQPFSVQNNQTVALTSARRLHKGP